MSNVYGSVYGVTVEPPLSGGVAAVALPEEPADWQDDRLSDFMAMRREWGLEITRNGLNATCIKSPDVIDRMMRESSYLTDIRATFDLLRTDYVRLDMAARAQFSSGNVSYEIVTTRDDGADPIVQFTGVRLK